MRQKYKYISLDTQNPFLEDGDSSFCTGWVYAVRFDRICKIGTSRFPPPRIVAAQLTMGRTFDEVHLFPADWAYQAELLLLKHFEAQRIQTSVGKEWFNLDEDHMAYIRSIDRFEDGHFITTSPAPGSGG